MMCAMREAVEVFAIGVVIGILVLRFAINRHRGLHEDVVISPVMRDKDQT